MTGLEEMGRNHQNESILPPQRLICRPRRLNVDEVQTGGDVYLSAERVMAWYE